VRRSYNLRCGYHRTAARKIKSSQIDDLGVKKRVPDRITTGTQGAEGEEERGEGEIISSVCAGFPGD